MMHWLAKYTYLCGRVALAGAVAIGAASCGAPPEQRAVFLYDDENADCE